jgi:capsular polysaccharide transport system permease protein
MTRTTPAAPPALPPAQLPTAGRNRRFASLRTIAALVLREMTTRYGRTPGGYLWAILEPLAAILFLSLGFSLVMRSPSLGTSFLLFYATGYLPFDLYNTIANTTARAVKFSKPLLKFPAVTWLDAVAARFLLNLLTGTLVAILLVGAVLFVVKSRAVLDLPPAVLAMALAAILGLGVGALNCVLMGLYPLWEVAWSVITKPLFLASGVLYIYEDLPPLAQNILWYNPLLHITGLMRTGFYPTYTAAYVNVPFVLFTSLILLALGLVLMGRYHRDILNR